MNINSPTTLLSSIQFMKHKLNNDKILLEDIRNEFYHLGSKKQKLLSPTIPEEPNNERGCEKE